MKYYTRKKMLEVPPSTRSREAGTDERPVSHTGTREQFQVHWRSGVSCAQRVETGASPRGGSAVSLTKQMEEQYDQTVW